MFHKIYLLLTCFLLCNRLVTAGQIAPNGQGFRNILIAIQKKDMVQLRKYMHPGYINFNFYESQAYWTPKLGPFEKSDVANLITDGKFLIDHFKVLPASDYTGPNISLSETLNTDFYADSEINSNQDQKIGGKKYKEAAISIYYKDFEYTLNLLCTSEKFCLLSDISIRGVAGTGGETWIKWEKACDSNLDMYGRPMKKTECPDH